MRMKRFCLCLFFSWALVFIIPAFVAADDKPATEEVKQTELQPQVPVVTDSQPGLSGRPVISSEVISPYDSNAAASKAVERNVGFFSTRIKEKFSL
jgi:hypothetical protein